MKINKNIRASISYRTRELQKLLHSSELDFFAKVRALIRFLEVTWHPTIGLFPAKIPWAGNIVQQNLWRQRVTVYSYPRVLTAMQTRFALVTNTMGIMQIRL